MCCSRSSSQVCKFVPSWLHSPSLHHQFHTFLQSDCHFLLEFIEMWFVLLLLWAMMPTAQTSWNYVAQETARSPSECMLQCLEDIRCVRYTYFPVAVASTNDDVTIEANTCMLQAELIADVIKRMPTAFATTNGSTSGVKHISKNGSMSIEKVLEGPLATSTNTLFNSAQHFVRGCSYTVALWVWLWKSRREFEPRETVIFSTRPTNSRTIDYEPLLPSIIFHGSNRLFFSAQRDDFGDYSGYQTAHTMRYHEWTHIALTITHNRLAAIINGELISSIIINPPREPSRRCPYLMFRPGDEYNVSTDVNSNASTEKIQAAAWRDATVPNTIFQIAGDYPRYSPPFRTTPTPSSK